MAREAHATARLGHPALVRVFDFGWTNRGDPYLVMELVQGETLNACLSREGRLSAIRAVQMLLPLADGLRVAHDSAIVHRDVKPDNIFLATDSLGRVQPKLIDFGIAKIGAGNVDGKLTQVGVVLGSPEYMSPEQALGIDDVDERTDVWSLAVVLYEMVTGAMPFKKANYNALMQAIIHEPAVAMTELSAGDESLWRVVERGLAKNRERRWSTMAEFGEALALWLYEHGIKEDICGNSIRAVWLDGPLSGLRIERIPTAPPDIPLQDSIAQSHEANGATIARNAHRKSVSVFHRFGERRIVFLAVALGTVFGGVIAALALGVRPSGGAPLPATTPSVVASSRVEDEPGGVRLRDSEGNNTPTSVETIVATPVENLPKENDAADSSDGTVGKGRGNAAATTTRKTYSKGAKRRHDFGF
jgi:serine/threonine-protein kinase